MTITLVQHAGNAATFTSGTSGTVTATFGASTTAGNCLVACVSWGGAAFNTTDTPSVNTNGSAENWTEEYQSQNALDTGFSSTWVNWDTGGSQTAIKVPWDFGNTPTTSNSNFLAVDVYEVSGLISASNPTDQGSNQNGTSSGTSWDSGTSSMTTNPNEIWFGVGVAQAVATNTAATITGPGGGWNNEAQLSTSYQSGGTGTTHQHDVGQMSGYQIVSSEGTADYSGTVSTSSATAASVTTFAAPVAATTSTLLIASFPL